MSTKKRRYLWYELFSACIIAILALTVLTPKELDNIDYKVTQDRFQLFPTNPPSPQPKPTPLSRADMDRLYGPCIHFPVLYYHHIETTQAANNENHTALYVDTGVFKKQIQYLKEKGYQAQFPHQLFQFFSEGTSPPQKSLFITFDDGYDDFYTDAYPILREFNTKAIVFLPTGLIGNKGYLDWHQISEMQASGLIYFANHTWSHKTMRPTSEDATAFEIGAAETQLRENGLNTSKIFAYPYGEKSLSADNHLKRTGYTLAFSTQSGTYECKGQQYFLPRLRVRNAPLSTLGF